VQKYLYNKSKMFFTKSQILIFKRLISILFYFSYTQEELGGIKPPMRGININK